MKVMTYHQIIFIINYDDNSVPTSTSIDAELGPAQPVFYFAMIFNVLAQIGDESGRN